MRKFTSFLLMLLCAVTTWAQTSFETSTAESPKYYTIGSYDRGGYLTNMGVGNSVEHVGMTPASMWYFESANENGGVYFVNYLKDGENKIYLGADKKASTTPAVWYILPNGVNDSGMAISSTNPISSSSCIDANNWSTGVGAWHPAENDWAGTTWKFEPASPNEVLKQSLISLIASAKTAYNTANSNIGTIMGRHIESTVVALNDAITVAEAIENATLKDIEDLQAAIDGLKIVLPTPGTYYQLHSALAAFNPTKAVYSNGSNPMWKSLDNDDKSFYWKAVATETGVALQNVNDNKYIAGNPGNSGAWSMSDTPVDISVKILSDAENEKGYEYAIIGSGRHMHANGHGGGSGNASNIVTWETNSANSASAWFIVEVEYEQFYDVVYNFKYNGEVKLSQTVSLKEGADFPALNLAFPYGTSSDYAQPEGKVTGNETKDFTLTINKKLPFEVAADVESISKWYYVRMHTNQPGYIGEIADNNTVNVAWGKSATDENHADFVWGFVGNIWDGIKVINKNRGLEMTSTGGGNVTLTNNGTQFFVAQTSETSANAANGFCLRRFDSNQYLNANYAAGKLSHWSSTDAGSTFFLTECTEHKVTVSAADYATLYLNYPVYIPADVEAYTVNEKVDNYVTLTQVTGTLPANTGVILKNQGDYTFPLSITAKDGVTSMLQGTVANEVVTPNGTAYVLGLNNEGVVGLYKAELDENDGTFLNNANKAYLVVPAASQAVQYFSFNFGGGTTGIEGVEAEAAASGKIYDITGREVKAITTPGIYIVGGKKVVVK